MLNHVVLLKWKAGTPSSAIDQVTAEFSKLPNSISQIRGYSFGRNMGLDGSNFDYALVARFSSRKDFEEYVVHPAHQTFMAKFTNDIVDDYGAVQYIEAS